MSTDRHHHWRDGTVTIVFSVLVLACARSPGNTSFIWMFLGFFPHFFFFSWLEFYNSVTTK